MGFRRVLAKAVATGMVATLLVAGHPPAGGASTAATGSADTLRTGWYPDQTSLTPALVSSGTFGQLFSTAIVGQVYAQPLVISGVVLVVTEANWVYGIDAVSGAIRWSRNVGTPFNPQDVSCGDLSPSVGITGTPAIDEATNTAYFLAKSYVSGTSGAVQAQIHAVDIATGAERSGFPATIQGNAQNQPGKAFTAKTENQRSGLLLMNGVVYAAFAAHCDVVPYSGWVVGVSTAGTQTAMFTTRAGSATGSGAGIWQSGGGLVSDRSGSIVFATGNGVGGGSPTTPAPGNQPPADLGESVVRLNVQPDGTLAAQDFFTPFDAAAMDTTDADLGSGGPVALPPQWFGTASVPNVILQMGKQGYLYVLDANNLGGVQQGPGGGDKVVNRLGPIAALYSHPAVWPGDGGYVYMTFATGSLDAFKYGVDGAGKPTFSQVGKATATFGFGSGAPVVTSNSTTSGSALVWVISSPDSSGANAQLLAYDPVPNSGGVLVPRFAAPIGTSSKFARPGVGGNRIYVGTRDGHLLGFGAPVNPPVTVPAVSFPTTTVGQSSLATATITANAGVTVSSLSTSGAAFSAGTPSRSLPATLSAGQSMTVPLTFSPTTAGNNASTLNVTTSSGQVQTPLSGSALAATGTLTSSPVLLSFGGTPIGGVLTGTVTFSNAGGTPVTLRSFTPPAPPFSVTALPPAGTVLAPGASVSITVSFAPTAVGQFTDSVTAVSDAGSKTVPLSGSAAQPGVLTISPLSLDFGALPVGATKSSSFNVSNTGASTLTLTKSKPPSVGQFHAITPLPEQTTLTPGQSVTIQVTFAPTTTGQLSDTWVLNSDQPGSTLQTVTFTGVGGPPTGVVVPDPSGGGWSLNGTASLLGSTPGSLLQLTSTAQVQAGSAFWPTPVSSSTISASFDATIGGGTVGADGLTFMLADPTQGATPSSLGQPGGGLGASGVPGVAVTLRTYPSDLVGISSAGAAGPFPNYLASTSSVTSLRAAVRHVQVSVQSGSMTVAIDGVTVLSAAVSLPPNVLVGFTGGTGGYTDQHAVANVVISTAATPGVLSVTPGAIDFGTVTTGSSASRTISITNTGGSPLTVTSSTGPSAPYSVIGWPATGAAIAPGATVMATVTFAPTATGTATGTLSLGTSAGNATVSLTGVGTPLPAALSLSPSAIAFGSVPIGTSTTRTLTVANTGGSPLTISSISGLAGPFSATGLPAAGASLAAGQSVSATISFAPTDTSAATATLSVATSAGSASTTITGAGTTGVVIPDPTAGGWKTNRSASLLGTTPGSLLQLTPATAGAAGSAFWPMAVSPSSLVATFDMTIGGGTGADGLAFILADPSKGATSSSVGSNGSGLGYSGIAGVGVGFVTFTPQNPLSNFVGISTGAGSGSAPPWVVTSSAIPPLRTAVRHVRVAIANGTMTVSVDGIQVLSQSVTLPPSVLVGFSGGNGGMTDQHAVANVSVTAGSAPAAVSVSTTSLAFGSVATNAQSTKTFAVSDIGGQPLTVQSTSGPTGAFSATGLPAAGSTITAGGSVTVTVKFAPTVAAAASATITMVTSGGTVSVALTGTGTLPPAVLSVSPASLAFGSVTVGTTATGTFTIANTGGKPLTITAITGPSAPFTLSGLPVVGSTIAPGASIVVTVTYSPIAKVTSSAKATITSSAGSSSVALSGTGT